MSVPSTRNMRQMNTYRHVLDNVIELEDNHPISLALLDRGIDTIPKLLCIHYDDIPTMEYVAITTDNDGNEVRSDAVLSARSGEIALLRVIIAFVICMQALPPDESTPGRYDWYNAEPDDFEAFQTGRSGYTTTITFEKWKAICVAEYASQQREKATIQRDYEREERRASRPLPVQPRDLAAEFQRGIRRSKLDYVILKDMASLDGWKKSFEATAHSHQCSEILNPGYVPATEDEARLFTEKSTFMYSVFDTVLKDSTARSFFHANPNQPQLIWKDLMAHSLTSAAGNLENQRLLKYLTGTKFYTDEYKGSATDFLIEWDLTLRTYQDRVTEQLSDAFSRSLLENAVEPCRDLNSVKTANNIFSANFGGRPIEITYARYYDLLKAAATAIDQSSRQEKRRSRQAFHTESLYYDSPWDSHLQDTDYYEAHRDSSNHGISYGTSYDVSYAGRGRPFRGPYRPSLSKSVWESIPKHDQELWDQLSQDTKASILNYAKTDRFVDDSPTNQSASRANAGPTTAPRNTLARPFPKSSSRPFSSDRRSVNFADASTTIQEDDADLVALQQLSVDEEEYYDASSYLPERLAYIAGQEPSSSASTANARPHGDVRRLMSTSNSVPRHKSPSLGNTGPSPRQNSRRELNSVQWVANNAASNTGIVPATPQPTNHTENSVENSVPNDNSDPVGTIIQGSPPVAINTTETNASYSVTNMSTRLHAGKMFSSLCDRGANGGVCGSDMRVINVTDRRVDLTGIDNHEITDLKVVTAGGIVRTTDGERLVIVHQYAHCPSSKTIHSPAQLEHYKSTVDDKSSKVPGGKQHIKTVEGHIIPMSIRNGLAYIDVRPFTDREWNNIPHIILTSDEEWDPKVFDCEADEVFYDAVSDPVSDLDSYLRKRPFSETGIYTRRVHANFTHLANTALKTEFAVSSTETAPAAKGDAYYEKFREYFLYRPLDKIRKTFENTTQYARSGVSGDSLHQTYKSPFPALNVFRRNEVVATDTIYADEPALDNGSTLAQIFVGRQTGVVDVYPMKSASEFPNVLQDQIRQRGAMSQLSSDYAEVEISQYAKDILRAYNIDDRQSEPHYQHQNYSERVWGTIKDYVNIILNRCGAPAGAWLLCLLYVVFIVNRMSTSRLYNRTPIEELTGITPDISMIYRFKFWERVAYSTQDAPFGSNSGNERLGYFAGFSVNVGHPMTYKIVTADTNKVIHRSRIRSVDSPETRNIRAETSLDPDKASAFTRQIEDKQFVKSHFGGEDKPLPTFDPDKLVGRTFLKLPEEDGTRFRARIVERLAALDQDLASQPEMIRFRCTVNENEYDEIVAYNDIVNFIESEQVDGTDGVWKFHEILDHEGPLAESHERYMGSKYNVLLRWETGEQTWEPLSQVAKDDPVTCAIYAKNQNLLDIAGWKQFKKLAKRQKKITRLLNQAKLKSYRTAPRYKYGIQVPIDYNDALRLDRKNGDHLWGEAVGLEIAQLDEYSSFTDLGNGAPVPNDHKKITVHLVFDVKHDGRHKARLVAGGHLTPTPIASVYSGVVSLRALRIVTFLSELNGLNLWATDIGNAYLEAFTDELVVFRAGPEFGPLEGHLLKIVKALYGLRSSGLRWHERLAEVLTTMGFQPCKAEPDVWMRRSGDIYEYIASYVDDLAIVAKHPEILLQVLKDVHKFKLKGSGPMTFHLGCDYWRDQHGVLCCAPLKYIDRMVANYERMYGCKPKAFASPLEKGDHPELDTSDECDMEDTKRYQSLIGSLQWAISLGRFDIGNAVMTLSSFRVNPRKAHLERAKRIVGYLSKMKHGTIRVRTGEPDYSDLPENEYSWEKSVYGKVVELLPTDAPEPLGNPVVHTSYVDANLYHDMLTGRSVTATQHWLNQTPIDWYCKKQDTVESATYGSEFVAARIVTDQNISMRITLRYLGVPVKGPTRTFGDNESVVNSSNIPHAKLHKRHVMLSFHRVREAIAAKLMTFNFISGDNNPADILSKAWGYTQVWPTLKPVLFWEGDTMDC